jgi:hypothetical protein
MNIRNTLRTLWCHERDGITHNTIGKANFTLAEWYAPEKESGKQAHQLRSPLTFYI